MQSTRRVFLRNSLGIVSLAAMPSLLFKSSQAQAADAETIYLFVSERAINLARASSIHRYASNSSNPGVFSPAPSAGKQGALWGKSEGKSYKGMRFRGMVIAPNGDLYVTCPDAHNVIRFDGQTGKDKGEVIGGLESPSSIAIGEDDNLYITCNVTIARCDLEGKPVPGDGQIGNIFALGSSVKTVSGLAFGPDKNLYVANQAMGHILRFGGESGEYMGVFSVECITAPSEIAFGADGNLYVACLAGPGSGAQSGYVARFDGVSGKLIDIFAPEAKGAFGLAFGASNDLFVSGYWNNRVARYDAKTGKMLEVVVSNSIGGAFSYLALAKQQNTAAGRLEPVVISLPARAAMKTDPNTLGADTVKGWKNALLPKGVPGPLLTLASKNKTDYSILLPANPSMMDQKATALLVYHLKRMTGARFAIVHEGGKPADSKKIVSVGHTELLKKSGLKEATLDLGKEGYAIGAKGNNLFLVGGTMRGAINAVYSLLEEDLICRWYSSDVIARIPRKETLSFRPSLRHFVPVLDIRDPFYFDAFDTDWSIRNKTDSPSAPIPAEWGGYAKNPPGYFVHTYNVMVPPEKYFKDHPEYFAEVAGKRQPSQLDLSNAEVLHLCIEAVKQALRDNPGSKYISVSPNDGRGYCECQFCSAIDKAEAMVPGSKSGSLIKFVNQVADAIAPEFPDVTITTLAYLDTFMPPKTFRPHKNVSIQLCTDSHAWRYLFLFVTETEKFQTALKAWNVIGAEIHIWDYTTDFAHYMVPLPNMPVVIENIKFYIEHGAKGVMLQGDYQSLGGENSAMRSWVWGKQLWDPSRDTYELMRDFIYGYYGSAADPIWAYNDMLWRIWQENHAKPHMLGAMKPDGTSLICNEDATCTAPPTWAVFTPEFLDKSTKYFSQAEALAKDPETLLRVKVAKLPLIYVKIGQGLGYYPQVGVYITGSWIKNPTPGQKEYYASLLNELLDIMKAAKITALAESSTVDKIVSNWKNLLQRDWKKVPVHRLSGQWKFRTDPQNIGVADGWFMPQAINASWTDIRSDLGGINGWEHQGFKDYKGLAWYQQTLMVPAELEKSPYLYLYFGAVDSESEIYINGKKVFEHTLKSTGMTPAQIWNDPFAFDPRQWLKSGENNTIAVRVTSAGGVRGIWEPVYLFSSDKKLDVPSLTNAAMMMK